ncbi:MAG: VCBS repeat-containing protein [Phycisphaerae bacterium]|nr:VCBS repeat-containing protein [Phycisphaerae bacterium]
MNSCCSKTHWECDIARRAAAWLLLCAGSAAGQCFTGFGPVVTFPSVSLPRCITAGDFDGDGILDLAVGAFGNANVQAYRGVGNGTFMPATAHANAGGGSWIATGDFNRDGKLDLVTATQTNMVTVLVGNGNLTFQPPSSRGVATAVFAGCVGDFNRDGKLDVACSLFQVGQPALAVLLGNGDGTLQAPLHTMTGWVSAGLATADMNRDGKPDLVMHHQGPARVSVLLGNGSGGFSISSSATPVSAQDICVGDWNGDGSPDIAFCNSSQGALTVMPGDGAGGLGSPQNYALAGSGPLIAADFDRDGALDIVGTNLYGRQATIFMGQGTGAFDPGIIYNVAANASVSGVAVGDFNGDGRLDIATANYNSANIGVMLQQSAFAPPVVTTHPPSRGVASGNGTVFNVAATGAGTLTYSWRRNGVVMVNGGAVSGQGSPSLTISPVDETFDLSAIDCVVSNACGAAASHPAALCVVPACIADINGDGGIDGADVEFFFSHWEDGC